MKATLGVLLAIALCACAGVEPAAMRAAPIALRNADFEAAPRPDAHCPEHWGCVMHADPASYRFWLETANPAQGVRSVCMERLTHEPFGSVQQSVQAAALQGRMVRLTVSLRGENLTGEGAGPVIVATGAAGAVIDVQQRISRVDGQWRRYSVEMRVPARTEALDVGATLLGGGRVCLDDVRLEQV